MGNLGKTFRARGWHLYGWKDDKSDYSTDYFDPEDWDGIATKDGFTVVVDNPTTRNSGKEQTRMIPVKGDTCAYCKGTGIDPNGLTYQQAKENPALQHATIHAALSGARPLFAGVVSPLHYTLDGKPKCLECGGLGYKLAEPKSIVECVWPKFQANPKHKIWHVEKDGKILASGVGLKACSFTDYDRAKPGCLVIVDKVEAAMKPAKVVAPKKPEESPKVAATVEQPRQSPALPEGLQFTRQGSWSWAKFASKPADSILQALRANGWHWSKKRCAWFHDGGAELPAF